MQIERKYFDEDEWELITEEQARNSLEKFYLDYAPIMYELAEGHAIVTDVATYRRRSP